MPNFLTLHPMETMKNFISKIAIFVLTITAITAESAANEPLNPFTDVDAYHLYYEAVNYLAANDIVGGYEDGTFKPDKTLNRAEMLKILVEGQITLGTAMKEDVELYAKSKCFNDIKTGEWYTKYVCHAQAQGWVQGYDNGKLFKPQQEVTFVEALKMTMKAFAIDYNEKTDPWYKGAVTSAGQLNYIPIDIDAFDLKLKRGQMADLLTRILKDKQGQDYFGFDYADKYIVTYETISEGRNLLNEYMNREDDIEASFETPTVEITSKGFSPKTLTISQGDTVKFINKDIEKHWPASDVHPTHTKYPGSGIDKCDTLDEYYIFDACRGFAQGEEFSFPFDEIGTWKYHDHLNPEIKGTIIVE